MSLPKGQQAKKVLELADKAKKFANYYEDWRAVGNVIKEVDPNCCGKGVY